MGYTCRAKLATAFHEAGHACVSLVLGRPIEAVSVMFHSQRVFFEHGQWLPAECACVPEQLDTDIMIGLAGALAEAYAVGQGHAVTAEESPSHGDVWVNEAIQQWLARGECDLHLDDDHIDWLRERTWSALTNRGCWDGVAAVAWALVYRVRLAPADVERLFWSAVAAHQRSEAERASVPEHAA
ncbi:MAG TPA: hypothetical protein VMV69_17865 [Pirellulales bacterium]|nr:hypothetical protein [Pirellulales bacterium]